jgi:hypothetical protein
MENQAQQQLFSIEGTIQALRLSPAIINLISDIQDEAFCSGTIAALSGAAGVAANSATLLMYEGEEVEHVALLVNDQLVIGTFEWLQDLKVNDHVKLVVSKLDDGPLFAHAILRNDDLLLWTPYSVNHTRRGWIIHSIKLGVLTTIGTWLIFGSFYLMGNRPSAHAMANILIFIALLNAFVLYMSTKGVLHLGEQAEQIFRALNVPKHENFRIKPFSILNMDFKTDPNSLKKKYIFRFSAALDAHKKKFNLV